MTEEERQQRLLQLRQRAKESAANPPAQLSDDPGFGEVMTGAVQNFPSSGLNVLKDTVAPITDFKGTMKGLGRLGAGVLEKAVPGEQSHEKYADAVGEHFSDRYGSWKGFKKAVRDDPAGVMADASIPLTMGGSVLARGPGVVGKAGRIAQTAGNVADPTSAVIGTGKAVAKYVPHAIGAHTGVGQTPLHEAYEAGKSGNSALLEQSMRGDNSAPALLEVVDDARKGMSKAYSARSAQYQKDMSAIGNVNGPVSQNVFQSIGKAAGNALNMHRFNGVDFSPKTAPVRKEIYDTVVKWGSYDPQTFHTPEGLDKMKREIGDIRDGYDLGTPEFKAADGVYKAIDNEIDKVFPEYATAMQNYAKNSKRLDNLSRTLSLGGKATDDTTLRKLQSSMRHDVNTNYGGRLALIDELEKYAPGIKQRLAGQSLNSMMPRGLSKHFGMAQLGGAATLALHNPLLGIPLGLSTAMASPRLMGEAALLSGKVAGKASRATPSSVKELPVRHIAKGSRALGMLSDEEEMDWLN
jgi:hypothetical protein